MRPGNEVSLGAGSWWPEAPVPEGEVTAVKQVPLGGNEEAEGSTGWGELGIKQIFTGGREVPSALEKVRVGLCGLVVPSQPVVDLVQVSAQEYGERHEAEL